LGFILAAVGCTTQSDVDTMAAGQSQVCYRNTYNNGSRQLYDIPSTSPQMIGTEAPGTPLTALSMTSENYTKVNFRGDVVDVWVRSHLVRDFDNNTKLCDLSQGRKACKLALIGAPIELFDRGVSKTGVMEYGAIVVRDECTFKSPGDCHYSTVGGQDLGWMVGLGDFEEVNCSEVQ